MASKIVDRQPSPRALIRGFDRETQARLAELFPTARVIDDPNDVRQTEWDLLVTDQTLGTVIDPSLYVVAIGAYDCGEYRRSGIPIGLLAGARFFVAATLTGGSHATEFRVPDDLDDEVERLVHADLLPTIRRQSVKRVLGARFATSVRPGIDSELSPDIVEPDLLPTFRPILESTEPALLAGRFWRPSGAELWWLPEGVDVTAWTKAAMNTWGKLDATRFPPTLDAWRFEPQWESPPELSAREALDGFHEQQAATLLELDRRQADLEAALEQARAEADHRERLLLTAQGDDLVRVVSDALTEFGLVVQNMDAVRSSTDRLEDLQVSAPDSPGWTALVEVRGYAKGAHVSDLIRITGRFVARYQADEGTPPAAAWYVVNHFLAEPPAGRPRVLQGADDDIQVFAESDAPGLVIDTARLFELWVALEHGRADRGAICRHLMVSRGLLEPLPDVPRS